MRFNLVETLFPYVEPKMVSENNFPKFIKIISLQGRPPVINKDNFEELVNKFADGNLLKYAKMLDSEELLADDKRMLLVDNNKQVGYLWLSEEEDVFDPVPNQLLSTYFNEMNDQPLKILYLINADGISYASILQGNLNKFWLESMEVFDEI